MAFQAACYRHHHRYADRSGHHLHVSLAVSSPCNSKNAAREGGIFCTGKRLKRVGAAGTCGRFPGSPALPEKPAGIPIPGTVFPAAEFTPFGTPAGRFPHPTPRCCQRAARCGGSPWQSVSQHCSGDTASRGGRRTPGQSPGRSAAFWRRR